MVQVVRSTVIDAPIDTVWQMLRDFNGHDRWHPAVDRSDLEDGRQTDQVGAVRSFVLRSGQRLREQLLSLSDNARALRYAIVQSEIPLLGYVAEIRLRPVTDGNRTFWRWASRFETPAGQERELADLVAREVYEAGFAAIRARLEAVARTAARPASPSVGGAAIPGSAVEVARFGGPDVLRPVAVRAPAPGPGQVRISQTAVGVNYIDVYCRSGYFPLLAPPAVPGLEAAGVVVDTGLGVTHLHPGMRVAYACPPPGAYASVRTMDARLVLPAPDWLDDRAAAAALLKGLTAEYLLHRVHRVQAGETVLVFAPAGGVGRLLCQWARRLGATVIGATSSPGKAAAARAAGASHVITPGAHSLEAQVMDLTGGRGADVVFDAVGADTFAHSVAALAPTGHLVSFGQASGDIGWRDIGSLADRSVTLSRPNYVHYTSDPAVLSAAADRLFTAIRDGTLRIEIGRALPLSQAAEAHQALEGRSTVGATVLIPDSSECADA